MQLMMVDSVEDITDISISTVKYFTINEPIFESHFPGNPVVPAAFNVEAAVQSARIFVYLKSNMELSAVAYEFNKFKFRSLLHPCSVLETVVKFDDSDKVRFADSNIKLKVEGISDGKCIFSGEILCKTVKAELIHDVDKFNKFISYLNCEKNMESMK